MDGSFEDVYKKKILQSVCMSNFSSMTDAVTGQECIPLGYISPAFLIPGGGPYRDPPWTETPTRGNMGPGNQRESNIIQRPPRRNMGPDSQTGSDIIQRPPPDNQTSVKTLPCPKLRLRAVKKSVLKFVRYQYPFYMYYRISEFVEPYSIRWPSAKCSYYAL